MSGSVSTGSILNPGGSQNFFCCSAGDSATTGGFFEKSGSLHRRPAATAGATRAWAPGRAPLAPAEARLQAVPDLDRRVHWQAAGSGV